MLAIFSSNKVSKEYVCIFMIYCFYMVSFFMLSKAENGHISLSHSQRVGNKTASSANYVIPKEQEVNITKHK